MSSEQNEPRPASETGPTPLPGPPGRDPGADPHAHRMSLGEHLDELRAVVIRSIFVLVGAIIVCIWPAWYLLEWTVHPLRLALLQNGQPDSLLATSPVEPLLMYAKVVIFLAIVVAAPIIFGLIWSFVAKGLYKNEKQWVYRLIPVSAGLFLTGVAFMYTFVLVLSLNFLIGFASWLPLPSGQPGPIAKLLGIDYVDQETAGHDVPPLDVPVYMADPAEPPTGGVWFNQLEQKLKVSTSERTYSVQLQRDDKRGLVTTHLKIGDYLNFVLVLAIAFGMAFQIPLVVVFLTKTGIVPREKLASYRKGVILGIVIVAGMIAPPDLMSHVMLSIPMVLLFEIGLLFSPRTSPARSVDGEGPGPAAGAP